MRLKSKIILIILLIFVFIVGFFLGGLSRSLYPLPETKKEEIQYRFPFLAEWRTSLDGIVKSLSEDSLTLTYGEEEITLNLVENVIVEKITIEGEGENIIPEEATLAEIKEGSRVSVLVLFQNEKLVAEEIAIIVEK